MLIGQYKSRLTDKNRLAVPKKIRDELGENMIIARWYEGCLVLVSRNSWKKLIIRLIGTTEIMVSPVRDIDRFVLASAFEINLDSQGRFVLPQELIEYAQITSDTVFVGLGDRVEIWPEEKWKQLEKMAEKRARKAIEQIAKINEGMNKNARQKKFKASP